MSWTRLVLMMGLLIGMVEGSDASPASALPTPQTPASSEGEDVPVVGRPVDLPFSEASGWFEVQAHAEPTTVQAERPLTLTLTVRAVRPPRRPPQRLDLRQLPDFAELFYIEEADEEAAQLNAHTWKFTYRLRPRRTEVSEIPSVPFVYFNPYLLTASKGFQVLYTDPIPLHVLPPETVQVPVQGPESAFVLTTGPSVLERRVPWRPPGLGVIGVVLLVPPLGCIVWYFLWQRLYPDATRLARQRRSHAARRALQALRTAEQLDVKAGAAQTAALVADYFQQRLDWAIAEPTPREVALLFAQHHFSLALTEQAVCFFQACDCARFLPSDDATRPSLMELQNAAMRLILTMEEETCSTLPS
jgi:hypothetical protein